ncbi:MAG: nucleotidyl transferase AbiEii/AbiGii toxin family protein [Steroidobacteraceae bacterium]
MYNDFKELLSALNAHRVRYLIIGGYAVSFHAEPRATKDLDILISPDAENGKAVYAALAQFGASLEGLSAKDFTEPDSFYRMGTPPVMVDILSRISGVEFESAWQRRVDVQIDDTLTVSFISRDDLLASKISAGRAQDLADVAELRESRKQSEISQPAMGALEKIEREQARGREAWLELRRKQAEKSAGSAPERSREHDDFTKDSEKGIDDDIEP